MRIHILSDLHLEHANYRNREAMPLDIEADVVVLAGDISVGSRGVLWAREAFKGTPVIYVPGNHEYYGGHLGETLGQLRKDALGSNVHVMDRDEVQLDGVRFLGATTWSDFNINGKTNRDSSMMSCKFGMSDFSLIFNDNGEIFSPEDAWQENIKSVNWLRKSLAMPFAGKTVVVTHHGCSAKSIAPRWEGNKMNGGFVSNLESLMGAEKCALWVHGHVHGSFDYEIEGTRIVVNPRGYGRRVDWESAENDDFNSRLVVEV